MSNIAPIGDRVLVQELEAEATTSAGIIIPESAQGKSTRGLVLAVSLGNIVNGQRIALDVDRGDTVIFTPYAGTEIKDEYQRKLIILSQQEILAVVHD